MDISKWETHTLLADKANRQGKETIAVIHYQLALAESMQLTPTSNKSEQLEDLLTIKVVSCHNLAKFWRAQGDNEYELKYLQLASEEVMTLLPQCPRTSCNSFVSSLGCCKAALIEFLKRHPNPEVAKSVKQIQHTSDCELIARFRLH